MADYSKLGYNSRLINENSPIAQRPQLFDSLMFDGRLVDTALGPGNLRPAGTNTMVQFNKGGTLSGHSSLTFNTTTKTLTVEALLGVQDQTFSIETPSSSVSASDMIIRAGNGSPAIDGGGIQVFGGNATGTGDNNGGNLSFEPGNASGTGTHGRVRIINPPNSIEAIFDTTLLDTSSKTFTFPNSSGTFALKGGVVGADIAANSITGTHIVDGGINGSDLAGSAVAGTHIALNAITNVKINDYDLTKGTGLSLAVTNTGTAGTWNSTSRFAQGTNLGFTGTIAVLGLSDIIVQGGIIVGTD